jgi:hypothetical protein
MGAPAAGGSRGTFVNEGFAGVPDAAPVKTLTVMSKKKKAEASGWLVTVSACVTLLGEFMCLRVRAACESQCV